MFCCRPAKRFFSIYISVLFLSVTHALLSADQPKFQRGNRSLFPKLNEEHQLLNPVVSSMSNSSSQDLICRLDQALSVGHKLCVIARGLPGRGKTTLVQEIVKHYDSCGEFTAIMVAADDYMIDSSGESAFKVILTIQLVWFTNILLLILIIQASTPGSQPNLITRIPNAAKSLCWLLNTGLM